MSRELAFVLINPYTIAKSRTGGVIARYLSRTDLDLVAVRMFGPSTALVREYATLVREAEKDNPEVGGLIADYILTAYAPHPETGRRRRVLMLLFEGEDAVGKVWTATGKATASVCTGETIRDTYGDFIRDLDGSIRYFEPAVLVGPTPRRTAASVRLWARYSETDGGLITDAADVPQGGDVQMTLVLLKPDNFRFHSSRPGTIVDLLSRSGLRIVAARKFSMTVGQAEEFYGPVREVLREKFRMTSAQRAAALLKEEFGCDISPVLAERLGDELGTVSADREFRDLIRFMTGFSPGECLEQEKEAAGREECLALVYYGPDAVRKIRLLLGPTDPSKAQPGSVRREFGSTIMVNAAHASDSPDNALREMELVAVTRDDIRPWVEKYYGTE